MIVKAGWRGADAEKAFKIAQLESTFEPTTVNKDDVDEEGEPGTSYGLFQIRAENHLVNLKKEFGDNWEEEILDPFNNIKFAFDHAFGEIGWDAWFNSVALIDSNDTTNTRLMEALNAWDEASAGVNESHMAESDAIGNFSNGDGSYSFASAMNPPSNEEIMDPLAEIPSDPIGGAAGSFAPPFMQEGLPNTDNAELTEFAPNFMEEPPPQEMGFPPTSSELPMPPPQVGGTIGAMQNMLQ